MARLRERLSWDATAGTLHDGPRRYLMMRPDVLMGAVAALGADAQVAMLAALAASIARHGADSLRAYAEQVDGDAAALMTSTTEAAADLGWGEWTLQRHGSELHLSVANSPFVQGWRAAAGVSHSPVCAPISGMLQALATQILQVPAQALECHCAANNATDSSGEITSESTADSTITCRFIAKPRT